MRKILRLLMKTVLALIVLSVGLIAVFRWIDPPFSSYMAQEWIRGAWHGEWPRFQYRWAGYDTISPEMRLAVVAAEDQKFPAHHGFDLASIREALEERRDGGRLRGASTISQQVAKNLFLWHGRSLFRKGVEAYTTLIIELTWPKRRILEVYLNIAETGPDMFGVATASQRYFRREPAELKRDQAALIAAALPNPKEYRVDAPSAYLRERQHWIADQMQSLGGPDYLASID